MDALDLLIQRMRYWCEEANLGYDQGDRWAIYDHGECDCSSLMYWALWEAGFLARPTNYRTRTLWTGTIADDLVAAGWERLPANIADLRPGDVLLSEGHHVALCVSGNGWGAYVAEANYGERGVTGNAPGDQTGQETRVTKVYAHSAGWDCILRWPTTQGMLDVDGSLGRLSVAEWQRQLGTTVDGVVSGQWKGNSVFWPNLTSVTFGGGGSSLVRAIQRKVGASVDGSIGPNTVKALQSWLDGRGYYVGTIDGVLGPTTAKAVQRSLNAGEWS